MELKMLSSPMLTGLSLTTLMVNVLFVSSATQSSDVMWQLYRFCAEEGLCGKNLKLKISRETCDISSICSNNNVTCKDGPEVFLVSDKCIALITQFTEKMLYLERRDKDPVCLTSNETFSSGEEAIKHIRKTLNTTNDTTVVFLVRDTDNAHHRFYLFVIPFIFVIALSCFIYWCTKEEKGPKLSNGHLIKDGV